RNTACHKNILSRPHRPKSESATRTELLKLNILPPMGKCNSRITCTGSAFTIRAMTALASAYTEEGFAIGADSLRKDMHGHVVTEQAVKIYETRHPDFLGAYGFAGLTALEFADGRPMLNVLESAKRVATGLVDEHFDCAQDYAERFCSKL